MLEDWDQNCQWITHAWRLLSMSDFSVFLLLSSDQTKGSLIARKVLPLLCEHSFRKPFTQSQNSELCSSSLTQTILFRIRNLRNRSNSTINTCLCLKNIRKNRILLRTLKMADPVRPSDAEESESEKPTKDEVKKINTVY